jgi:DNA-binding MarR family transcriptional regulator
MSIFNKRRKPLKFQNIDSEFLPTSSSFIVKVIHRTSTLLTKNTAIKFSSITDLNVVEWRVVSGIHFFGTATQKMLVEYTGGDQAQTSRILATLKRKGIVDSQYNGEDRRARNFKLTKVGQQAVTAALPSIANYFSHIDAALTPEEKHVFVSTLNKLLAAASAPTKTE